MEIAAAEGCRTNSLRGIHGVCSATEVEAEILEVKVNLQICPLDFLVHCPDLKKFNVFEGIDFGLVNCSHDGRNVTIYCKYWLISRVGAEPTTWWPNVASQNICLRG